MNYEDQVLALIREGNPIPDPDMVMLDQAKNAVYLATLEQRSSEMTQLDTRPAKEKETRRGRLILVMATVTVAVLIGLVFAFSQPEESVPPATQPTSTTVAEATTTTGPAQNDAALLATAQAFMQARAAGEGQDVVSLLAADARVSEEFISNSDEVSSIVDWERAVGWTFSESECSVRAPGEVRCTYVLEMDMTRAIAVGPYTGNNFDLVIEGGEIQSYTHNLNSLPVIPEAWDPFLAWVLATHPEDVASMYVAPTAIDEVRAPIMSPESIALWEAHTAEFVAEQG